MWTYKEFKLTQKGLVCDEGFHISKGEESRIETDHDEKLAKAITDFLNTSGL